MGAFFNAILHQPLFNALVFLYNTIAFQDLGIAIVLLTLAVRLILYPLFYKSFRNQSLMQKLQPEIQKIQHEHKHNREKQAQALMELYRQHRVNPFSGFLLILVQLPVLIVLYRLFLQGITPDSFANLYSFVSAPAELYHSLLGLIDLQSRSILIVVLAAVLQYAQGRLSLPKRREGDPDSTQAKVGRSMIWVGPALTVAILATLPAAVGVYWFASSAFSIIQQLIINKQLKSSNAYESGISAKSKNDSGPARS